MPYLEAYGEGFEDMERHQPDNRKLYAFLSSSRAAGAGLPGGAEA